MPANDLRLWFAEARSIRRSIAPTRSSATPADRLGHRFGGPGVANKFAEVSHISWNGLELNLWRVPGLGLSHNAATTPRRCLVRAATDDPSEVRCGEGIAAAANSGPHGLTP
jgi:hypothetical protein